MVSVVTAGSSSSSSSNRLLESTGELFSLSDVIGSDSSGVMSVDDEDDADDDDEEASDTVSAVLMLNIESKEIRCPAG